MSNVLQPSQNGVDALAAAQRDLVASQEALEGLTVNVRTNTELRDMQDNLTDANRKTGEAIILLDQISDGMQKMTAKAGIDMPGLMISKSAPESPQDRTPTQEPAAPTDKKAVSPAPREALSAISTGDFARHALAFYGQILDTYASERARGGKTTEQTRQDWLAANQLMCEFALDIEDLQLANQCYGYIDDDAVRWDMVARAYHAGYPVLAEDWQAPLCLAIERGEDDTLTLVAAQKARASMALDRVNLAADNQDQAEQLREVDAAWQAASKLLDAARGNSMVPSKSQGLFESDRTVIPPQQDVRTHMLEFVKLYCANGEFQRAREIGDQINHLTRESEAYYRNGSRDAERAAKAFLPTLELREECAGLTTEEVMKRAKKWQLFYRPETLLSKVGDLLRKPGSQLWHKDDTPGLGEAYKFLEDTYPQITFNRPRITGERRAKYDIAHFGWEEAASTYEANLHWRTGIDGALTQLDDALQLARHEREGMAKAQLKQQEHISNIRRIQSDWQHEFPHADTFALPELRQAKLEELQAYIGQTHASITLQRSVFEALLEAQNHIAPKTNLVQEGINKYVKKKLEMLQSIPNYEQEYAGQLAELAAMQQLARSTNS